MVVSFVKNLAGLGEDDALRGWIQSKIKLWQYILLNFYPPADIQLKELLESFQPKKNALEKALSTSKGVPTMGVNFGPLFRPMSLGVFPFCDVLCASRLGSFFFKRFLLLSEQHSKSFFFFLPDVGCHGTLALKHGFLFYSFLTSRNHITPEWPQTGPWC